MNRIPAIFLLVLLSGCGGGTPSATRMEEKAIVAVPEQLPVAALAIEAPTIDVISIELFGRTWQDADDAPPPSSLIKSKAKIFHYRKDPTVRLVLEEAYDGDEVTMTEAYVQTSADLRTWMKHGPCMRWSRDQGYGMTYRESHYVLGKENGTTTIWRGGKLFSRREYFLGTQHGLHEGWYKSGQKQYESVYISDKEVSGKSWREDGTADD